MKIKYRVLGGPAQFSIPDKHGRKYLILNLLKNLKNLREESFQLNARYVLKLEDQT